MADPPDLDGSEFTPETALLAVEQAKKAKIEQGMVRKAEVMASLAVNAELVQAYDQAYPDPVKLSNLYTAASARIAQDVLTGQIEVRGSQAAQLIKELTAASRLVLGEATSITDTSTAEERQARIREIREQLDISEAQAKAAAEAGGVVVPIGS